MYFGVRKMLISSEIRKRKPGAGRKPNPVPTKAIRLPLPLVHDLAALKQKGMLEALYARGIETLFVSNSSSQLRLPLFESRVQAGFPSPADDFTEKALDLNEYLILHKAATFFVRVVGESMTDVGIFPGDLLIVDRSLTPTSGKIIIAVLNGETTVKRFEKDKKGVLLGSENKEYPDIRIAEEDDFSIWGVVTNVIHSLL